ncbi:MAG: dTDP-4-dehydrorhamnose 3,5-epimerase [Hyphomicrobium sp.]|nr:dTDP-4-dehydrorhamnose 3,5-epimerase [Hyphomicrobium sp.]
MKIESLAIPDVKLITPQKFGDDRGFFSEVWKEKALLDAGINVHFVQDNHAFSAAKGTVRGLHFQLEPAAQDKLVRITRGAVLDVAVDIRRSSPTFGRHVSAVLSAANWAQLWVPKGFAHGYCTLEPDTEMIYKVTNYYSPHHDRGIQFDDAALGIAWPVTRAEAQLSDKDKLQPALAAAPQVFD